MRFQVPLDAAGMSLARFLERRMGLSRTYLRRLRTHGCITLDGREATLQALLNGGEEVCLDVADTGRVEPEPIDLAIIYEDEHLLVVDKPAGMVVHPVRDYRRGTLAAGVAHHLLRKGEPPVARPVQRLDRETSGLILFAKHAAAAGRLAAALERHKLDRHYLAIVAGRLEGDRGTVDVPIRRVWGHPVAREVAVGPRPPEQEAALAEAAARGQVLRGEWIGQRAVTHWEVLRRWGDRATWVRLRLETGRTHQIRVHMAYLGHPLLGDDLYGPGGPPGRQALHAAALAFIHPFTGQLMRFTSPLPPDLRGLVDALDASEAAPQ
ncbi:MAG: RluA family pseudouridine synthase [Armatimonadota bacterium]|nr:RluA family pseudouridine synthase [Armatimonadota bacterium]